MNIRWRLRAQITAACAVAALVATLMAAPPTSIDAETIGSAEPLGPNQSATIDPTNPFDLAHALEVAAPDDLAGDIGIANASFGRGLVTDSPAGSIDSAGPGTPPTTSAGLPHAPMLDPTIPHADLSVSVTPEREPVLSESFLSYTVEVLNAGPHPAENVVVTATVPASASVLLMAGCGLNNDTFPDCHLNEIPAGESRSFEIMTWLNPAAAGAQAASMAVMSQTHDPNPTNNKASTTTTINTRGPWGDQAPSADLSITKADLIDPVPGEGSITYTITVANAGPGAAVDVEVTDTLPAGVTLLSTSGCHGGTGVPQCALGTIPPFQTRSFDVVVTADQGTTGDIINTASVTSRSFDPDPSNNVTAETTTVEFARLVIKVETLPGGDPQTFSFTGDLAGSISDGQTLSTNVAAGSYSATEIVPVGWALTGISCDDAASATPSTGNLTTATATFQLDAGETITCTFTNTRRGAIIVEQQTVPDNTPGTFSYSGDAAGVISDAGTITVADLLPGTYTSTQIAGAGLTGISCDDAASATPSTGNLTTATATFQLDAGETITCTFTNTRRGAIIVEQQTVPDNTPGTFSYSGDAAGVISDAGTITVADLLPGTYTSTQIAGAGLTGISCDDAASATPSTGNLTTATATFQLDAGETITCTFTNSPRGTIIVEKQTVPDNTPGSFSFTGDVAGIISDGGQIVVADLAPGVYTATENGPTPGFDLTDLSCADSDATGTPSTGNLTTATATFQLDAGETITCTFTNTRRGAIIVEQQTVPGNTPGTFSYSGDAAGVISDAGTITVADLLPGTYTSTQIAFATGTDLTGISCDDAASATPSTGNLTTATATFQLDAGETITCTFTNSPRGTIIVEKQTVPDNTPGSFSFTGDVAGIISDGGQIVVADLAPGVYTATESDPTPGFDLTDLSCADSDATGTASTVDLDARQATFNLDPGEIIVCTFTNTEQNPP